MQAFGAAASLAAAYVLGSTPVGLLVVRVMTGEDVRRLHSGRTGGTNVARAAGFWAGLATGVGDILKGAGAVWLARLLAGGQPWLEAAAGVLAILGHNYSIFLMERRDGKLRLHGGAGGAPTMGVALGLWAPSALIIIPISMLVLFGIGYASLATLSIGLLAVGTFAWRAAAGLGPWEYLGFAFAAEGLLAWALRPNIRRLFEGKERLVGWRARRRPSQDAAAEGDKSRGAER